MPIWKLSTDRHTRTSYGRPTFTYDPPYPTIDGNYDSVLELSAVATTVSTTTYDRVNDLTAVSPVVVTPPLDMPRPTGTGYYAIESLSGIGDYTTVAGFIAACNQINGLTAMGNGRRTLTLPAGVWSAPGFAQSIGNIGILVPDGVDIVGSGPTRTIFQVAPDSITAAQRDQPGGVYLMHWQKSTGGVLAQFGLRGTRQRVGGTGPDIIYSGLICYKTVNPQLTDMLVQGFPGNLNSPPGETANIGFNNGSGGLILRLESDGRDYVTGLKTSAAGIACNTNPGITFRDCYSHHMGYSHGFAFWQSTNVTTYSCRSENNGTLGSGGALGGTVGDGFNMEKSAGSIHYNPIVGGNTLCELRYYGRADGDAWSGDTTGHQVFDLVLSDGGALDIRIDNAQVTLPVLTRCPAPVYSIN
jgi:hypothetical protein